MWAEDGDLDSEWEGRSQLCHFALSESKSLTLVSSLPRLWIDDRYHVCVKGFLLVVEELL